MDEAHAGVVRALQVLREAVQEEVESLEGDLNSQLLAITQILALIQEAKHEVADLRHGPVRELRSQQVSLDDIAAAMGLRSGTAVREIIRDYEGKKRWDYKGAREKAARRGDQPGEPPS